MVLPIDAIAASIDLPGIVEVKPGQKSVRIVYRATLRNNGDETRVLHAPSTDHLHFWHLFDADLNEVDRERGADRGGEKDDPNPRRFRGLTLGPGQEFHETRTIRIDPAKLLSGPGRWVLRVDFWGQSAEGEFHTVVRPVRLTPAKKTGARKKAAAKKKPARRKAKAKAKATAKAGTKPRTRAKTAAKRTRPKTAAKGKRAASKKAASRQRAARRK